MRWDLYCRVIDNYGDAGVAWRLARDLAGRGQAVRLWIDDPAPLAWMAPGGDAGVEVRPWTPDTAAAADLADVVVELFGCEPPAAVLAAMAAATPPPVWIDLEYLSAEPYVERSHGLPSPQQAGPGRGLTRWFFYPGFSARTGGLLREPGLLAERARFDRVAWLAALGIAPRPGERLASLFCYPTPALDALPDRLATTPTLLLVAPGAAQQRLAGRPLPPALRTHALPWLTQPDFDRLLWACDLNFVRGEDSLVRAIWAGAPFVWQLYPQHDGAHAAKLDAFLDTFFDTFSRAQPSAPAGLQADIGGLMRGWNGLAPMPATLPASGQSMAAWQQACLAWRGRLLAQPDLTTSLHAFVLRKREAGC